ncbi:MAG: hypothetical protein JW982_03895 [Spirochaetes bacterium]|nr:hypothetical protein [Spirochaetota bacterium]
MINRKLFYKTMRKFIIPSVFIIITSAAAVFAGNPEIIIKNSTSIDDKIVLRKISELSFRGKISSIEVTLFKYESGSEIYTMNEDNTFSIKPGNIKISCLVILSEGKKHNKIFSIEIESETEDELISELCSQIQKIVK